MKRNHEYKKPVKKIKKFKKDVAKCEDQVLEKNEENLLQYHDKLIKKKSCKRDFIKSLAEDLVDNDNVQNLRKKKRKKDKNNSTEIDEERINNHTKKEDEAENEKTTKKKKSKIIPELEGDKIIDKNNISMETNEDDTKDVKKKEPSKRQLKKEKAELRAAMGKEANKQEAAQKALNYVSQWKHAKNQWKFEKLKQIWLINNYLDEKYIPETSFSIILEYFESCKGLARKQLLEKAEAVIKKAEENYEENKEIIETTEYKRAKQLIQALPNET